MHSVLNVSIGIISSLVMHFFNISIGIISSVGKVFRMYDLDGDGVITKVELGNVVVGVYELMGIILLPPVSLCEA